MTRLIFDREKDRKVTYGVEKGVLYPKNSPGVVWNGLISVEESESAPDVAVGYFDGQAYYREQGSGGFTAKVTSYSYPFDSDSMTGFSYVTQDQLHLVYNPMFSIADALYSPIGDSVDPSVFSWSLVTTPVKIPGMKASSHFIVDISGVPSETLESLQHLLYGTDSTQPQFPTIGVLLNIFEQGALFVVVDHGDGTWTATGPDSYFNFPDADSFEITSPSAEYIDADTYRLSSW